jgi:hypothetical protein
MDLWCQRGRLRKGQVSCLKKEPFAGTGRTVLLAAASAWISGRRLVSSICLTTGDLDNGDGAELFEGGIQVMSSLVEWWNQRLAVVFFVHAAIGEAKKAGALKLYMSHSVRQQFSV